MATYLIGTVLIGACTGTPPIKSPTTAGTGPTLGDLVAIPSAPVVPRNGDREQAISAYRAYLARYPDSPEHRTITRRLADLMVEQAADLQATLTDSAGEEKPRAGRAMHYYDEAIALYNDLLGSSTDRPERAELFYQLARALQGSGQSRASIGYLDRLIAQYPHMDTRIYADAQFRRGEIFFGEHAWQAAGEAYEAVVGLGATTAVYEQSLYKLGWCLIREQRQSEALENFFTLLDRKLPAGIANDAQVATLSPSDQALIADSLRAISLAFSSMDGVDSVADYFQRKGGREYESLIYRHLAEFYTERELYTEAARTWLALAQRDPDSSQAPRLYLKAIQLYEKAGLEQPLRQTRIAFVEAYGPTSAFWVRHPPATFPEVQDTIRSSLMRLAHQDHARARDSHSVDDFRQAEHWYRTWLAAYDHSPEAAGMHHGLAELLKDTGRYREAAVEFERSAYGEVGYPQAAEAAYGAVLARAQESKEAGADRAAGQALSSSAIRFVTTWPGHAAAASVLAEAGAKLLEKNRMSEAIEVSASVLQKTDAGPALRQVAWTLQAQAYDKLGKYPEAEHGYRQALERLDGDADRRKAITQALASVYYRQAEQYRDRGEARTAADLFRKAGRTAPTSPIGPKADYDAAASLLAIGNWDAAARILERLRVDPPDGLHPQELTQKLAYAYDRSERYPEAADEYLRLGNGSGDAAMRRAAFVRAAELYRAHNDLTAAVKALEACQARFSRPVDEVIGIEQELADLEQLRGRPARRRYWLQKIINTDRSAGAARSPFTREHAAQAALELAERQHTEFQNLKLVKPLRESLPRKLKAMRQALTAFEAAAGYGVPTVTTAATYRIASMYDELSQALLTSERPASLSGKALAEYERQLKQQAAAFENKAVVVYAANIDRRGDTADDAWVVKSRRRLKELQPVRLERGPPLAGPH